MSPGRVARCALAALSVTAGVEAGCTAKGSSACPRSCNPDEPAIVELCDDSRIVGVSLSGACSLPDAGDADGSPLVGGVVFVSSDTPGDCGVTLTSAGGTTATVAVTFSSQSPPEPAGCPACPPYIAPTQPVFSPAGSSCLAGRPDAEADGAGD